VTVGLVQKNLKAKRVETYAFLLCVNMTEGAMTVWWKSMLV
jgi:hypothetical protein